jgi:hypothetical protein
VHHPMPSVEWRTGSLWRRIPHRGKEAVEQRGLSDEVDGDSEWVGQRSAIVDLVLWPGLVVARYVAQRVRASVRPDVLVNCRGGYRMRIAKRELGIQVVQPEMDAAGDKLLEKWLLTMKREVKRKGLYLGVAQCSGGDGELDHEQVRELAPVSMMSFPRQRSTQITWSRASWTPLMTANSVTASDTVFRRRRSA